MTDSELAALEARIARLETVLLSHSAPALHPAWPLGLGLVALAVGYLGLGLPQHGFQPLFALLFLLLAYHRGFFRLYQGAWRWPLIGLNFLLLVLLFKLLLGGGVHHPLDWFRLPTVQQLPPSGGIWKILPHFQMSWETVPGVSDWNVDIPKIQSMLLIATLIGALFRFQPFASLTALALLLVSAPSYLAFEWEFVLLFLVIGGAAIYLQNIPRR